MEIALNAQVECTDGVCGHSVYLLVNPITDQVTHLVVEENSPSKTEYVVPVSYVNESNNDKIQLLCTRSGLEKLDPFIKTTVIEEKVDNRDFGYSGGMYGMGTYYLPFVSSERSVYETIGIHQLPPGDLAVRRGTRVEALDGHIGHVDEFMVNPENGNITHLVLREGHLWGKKDVIIPLSAIDQIREDTVFLKIDKHEIESLPTAPVNRHWA